jgi:hypothetical protein
MGNPETPPPVDPARPDVEAVFETLIASGDFNTKE